MSVKPPGSNLYQAAATTLLNRRFNSTLTVPLPSALRKPQIYQFGGKNIDDLVIKVYDSNGEHLCSKKQCSNSKNPTVVRLSQAIVTVCNFFNTVLGINGIDGKGTVPPIVIDTQAGTSWKCRKTVNGHSTLCFKPSYALEAALAYEYGHIWGGNRLDTKTPLGAALCTHYADIFAYAVETLKHQKELWTLKIAGRDATIPQHISEITTDLDPLFNSQIPTRAFYLAVKTAKVAAHGIYLRIWVNTLNQIDKSDNLTTFAAKTYSAAKDCLKDAHKDLQACSELAALISAWFNVGIQIPTELATKTEVANKENPASTATAAAPAQLQKLPSVGTKG